jgi:hypothetical protein
MTTIVAAVLGVLFVVGVIVALVRRTDRSNPKLAPKAGSVAAGGGSRTRGPSKQA